MRCSAPIPEVAEFWTITHHRIQTKQLLQRVGVTISVRVDAGDGELRLKVEVLPDIPSTSLQVGHEVESNCETTASTERFCGPPFFSVA
jgi:hypothetical protein